MIDHMNDQAQTSQRLELNDLAKIFLAKRDEATALRDKVRS